MYVHGNVLRLINATVLYLLTTIVYFLYSTLDISSQIQLSNLAKAK